MSSSRKRGATACATNCSERRCTVPLGRHGVGRCTAASRRPWLRGARRPRCWRTTGTPRRSRPRRRRPACVRPPAPNACMHPPRHTATSNAYSRTSMRCRPTLRRQRVAGARFSPAPPRRPIWVASSGVRSRWQKPRSRRRMIRHCRPSAGNGSPATGGSTGTGRERSVRTSAPCRPSRVRRPQVPGPVSCRVTAGIWRSRDGPARRAQCPRRRWMRRR